jgi:hypothetical protein
MKCEKGFEDHRRPITRRDFLGRGLIAGTAMITGPSLFTLLGGSREALAQMTCGVAVGGSGRIPFIAFDLAGGASVAGSNVMVGGPGGQLDFISADGYEKLGLPSTMLPQLPGQLNQELGLAFQHFDRLDSAVGHAVERAGYLLMRRS